MPSYIKAVGTVTAMVMTTDTMNMPTMLAMIVIKIKSIMVMAMMTPNQKSAVLMEILQLIRWSQTSRNPSLNYSISVMTQRRV